MFKSTQMIAIGLLVVSTAVWAHDPPDEIRNAVQFPAGAEPTIDGDCSDWEAVPGDQYWITNADLYPAYGGHHHDEGAGKGDIDPSSFDVTWRLGWSATTNQLYYCNSIFDDRHVIDRADPTGWDWWHDDGCEYFYTTRHLSEQEVRDLGAENINTYWGYNFALPRLPPPATWWMVIGICAGCDWLDTGSEFYTLEYTFDGEEYGESTYHYEQQSLPSTTGSAASKRKTRLQPCTFPPPSARDRPSTTPSSSGTTTPSLRTKAAQARLDQPQHRRRILAWPGRPLPGARQPRHRLADGRRIEQLGQDQGSVLRPCRFRRSL